MEAPSTTVINLKGRKPQELRKDEVYIGRAIGMGGWNLPQSVWYNPFRITTDKKKGDGTRAEVLRKYRTHITKDKTLMTLLHELQGKTLACWCKPEGCHGDVLLELIKELK